MRGNYRFYLSATGVHLADAQDTMQLPLEWAFGAGRQAVTFATRANRDWYIEHFASFYPALQNWAATPGQAAVHPKTLPEAAGVLYPTTDPDKGIAGCFECHSTGPVSFDNEGQVKLTETGVHCESCHGPGGGHRVKNPAKLSSAALNELCGKCHRPPAAQAHAIDWNYAWNVRHQPVYLNESACFRKSRGALSCISCHDPHEPATKHPAAFYNARCTGCHAPSPACATNCIDCHMPLVSPQPPLRFTNHWIGVYKPGAMLRPIVR